MIEDRGSSHTSSQSTGGRRQSQPGSSQPCPEQPCAAAPPRTVSSLPGWPSSSKLNHRQRQIPRILRPPIASMMSPSLRFALSAGLPGNDRNHGRVAEAFGDVDPYLRLAALVCLVSLVVFRRQVARVCIERLQQATQRAVGHQALMFGSST